MKTIGKLLGILLLITIVFSCSSVKVTDSWKDIQLSDVKDKKIMVISKTEDGVVRQQFETDLVDNLSINGVNSTESFKHFPEMSDTGTLNESQLKQLKKELKNNGIDMILLTVLKDVKEYTKTTTTGESGYYMNSYPIYRRGYHRGFYRYYNTIYIGAEPITSITSKGKKYILETIVYDLTQPENDQLLSVITTEIDNPQTLGTTSLDFSKKIVKDLIK